MVKLWRCIEVDVPEQDAELLSFQVAELLGAGVEMTPQGFRAYLDPDDGESFRLEETVRALVSMCRDRNPVAARNYLVRTFDVEEDDWTDRWKAHFKPLRVGRHFVVCPTWEAFEPGEDDRVIRMDPGRAFGTGHHETTRLCLQWIEEFSLDHPVHTMSLLDLGTGSGILAAAAALLGFRRIVALDIDAEAVEVARENLAVNGLLSGVHLAVGSLDGFRERFDTVVANIQAGPLTAMADSLSEHLSPGGVLVLSGILSEQGPQVQAAFEREGLRHIERRIDGEWCLLAFRRHG